MAEESLKVVLENLKASPLFNLSLASKELFHSNFLAWLCEQQRPAMGNIIGRWSGFEEGCVVTGQVEREKKHFDVRLRLTRLDGSTATVIIENKVKSIAYPEQLQQYAAKVDRGATLILLSVHPPSFFTGDIYSPNEGTKWRFVSYHQYLTALEGITGTLFPDDDLSRSLVTEYTCKFLPNLLALAGLAAIGNGDRYDFYAKEVYDELTSARMHDLFYKVKHAGLSQLIRKQLEDTLTDVAVSMSERKSGAIIVGSSLASRSRNGISEWHYILRGNADDPNRVQVGVQIEGWSFRLFVECAEKRPGVVHEVASELRAKGLWFDFSPLADWGESTGGAKGFYTYQGDSGRRAFKYQCVQMGPAAIPAIAEVAKRATAYAALAVRNREAILSVVDEVGSRMS